MLINLFQTIRSAGVPCTVRELLDLLGALENQLVYANIDDFYYLSRATLVKDEKHYDKFDKAFNSFYKENKNIINQVEKKIPESWILNELKKIFSNKDLTTSLGLGAFVKRIYSSPFFDILFKTLIASL